VLFRLLVCGTFEVDDVLLRLLVCGTFEVDDVLFRLLVGGTFEVDDVRFHCIVKYSINVFLINYDLYVMVIDVVYMCGMFMTCNGDQQTNKVHLFISSCNSSQRSVRNHTNH
jgi:hypothetical protein